MGLRAIAAPISWARAPYLHRQDMYCWRVSAHHRLTTKDAASIKAVLRACLLHLCGYLYASLHVGVDCWIDPQVKSAPPCWMPRNASRMRPQSGTALGPEGHQGLTPSFCTLRKCMLTLLTLGWIVEYFHAPYKEDRIRRFKYVVVFLLGRFGRLFGGIGANSVSTWCT